METRLEEIVQLAECIGRHYLQSQRDGAANSQGHLEKINEDAKAIHAIASGEDYTVPLHGL